MLSPERESARMSKMLYNCTHMTTVGIKGLMAGGFGWAASSQLDVQSIVTSGISLFSTHYSVEHQKHDCVKYYKPVALQRVAQL